MEKEKEKLFQMKGEYIGLMASLENLLTSLLIEYLDVESYREEFSDWFVEAPIPFNYKVELLKKMLADNTLIETNFPTFWKDLQELQKVRNMIAHSFISFGGIRTSRGKKIPDKQFTYKAVSDKLERLRRLENILLNMYADEIQGVIPPISADDYADWPM